MQLVERLKTVLNPNQVATHDSILEQHSHGESYHTPHLPDVVVFPNKVEDIVQVVHLARELNVPIVPFGAGTSLEGHVVPVRGGISLDLTGMNHILAIQPDDFLVCVEPGVTRLQLDAALKPYGLFFPIDPGANATLGGMTATNASGTTTVRYGAMRDNVRQLTVVMADGEVITAGSRTAKSSSGYNLAPLFVGSEGTLGVITSIWLRVYGRPETTIAASAQFPDVTSAVAASTGIVASGVGVARVEFVEAAYLDAVNRFRHTTYPLVPTLFMEFHGGRESVFAEVELAKEVAQDFGCTAFDRVEDEESRKALWEARHQSMHAFMAQFPGLGHMATDVCVPLSQLPEAITKAREALDELQIHGAIIGHVGDGNFHVTIALDPNNETELALAYTLNERVVQHALSVGGTCTGEHGVGLGKMKYQRLEHGPALDVMRKIKSVLDPENLFNPGKLIDEP